MTLKHWLLGGLVAALILGGLYGWTWLDPKRGLERRHGAFLGALEDRDWERVRGLMAADYRDGFGFDRNEVTKLGEEVFARFESLSISDQNRLVELDGTSGRITARIRVGGRGDPVALSIVRGSQMMESPTEFEWRRTGRPWEWELVALRNADVTPYVRQVRDMLARPLIPGL
jgi:hypothetical protein